MICLIFETGGGTISRRTSASHRTSTYVRSAHADNATAIWRPRRGRNTSAVRQRQRRTSSIPAEAEPGVCSPSDDLSPFHDLFSSPISPHPTLSPHYAPYQLWVLHFVRIGLSQPPRAKEWIDFSFQKRRPFLSLTSKRSQCRPPDWLLFPLTNLSKRLPFILLRHSTCLGLVRQCNRSSDDRYPVTGHPIAQPCVLESRLRIAARAIQMLLGTALVVPVIL